MSQPPEQKKRSRFGLKRSKAAPVGQSHGEAAAEEEEEEPTSPLHTGQSSSYPGDQKQLPGTMRLPT